MPEGDCRRDRFHGVVLERLAEEPRPGFGERAKGRFGPFQRSLGVATLALGHLAGRLQPRVPDVFTGGVLDTVVVQHVLDQRGELALLKLQQRSVTVERDSADVLDRLIGTDRRGIRFRRRLLARFAHATFRFLGGAVGESADPARTSSRALTDISSRALTG